MATVCLHGSAHGALAAAGIIFEVFSACTSQSCSCSHRSMAMRFSKGNKTANEGPNPPGLLLGQQTGEELLLFDATGLMSASFQRLHPLHTGASVPTAKPEHLRMIKGSAAF